jgi:non-specific serine/threonine protein kinase/serine/threonine-protein kinase
VHTDPSKWARIKYLFHAALERSVSEREAFLDEICEQDDELRESVKSLLASHEDSGDFLTTSVVDQSRPETASSDPLEGKQVGSYRVLSRIGHGGMGVVYLGARADESFQKRVAIKVVRPGVDAEEIQNRFRLERRTLALLDHPNIARLIDGGSTADGLLYFVMDHVVGEPIDQYCRAHNLSLEQRLGLFRELAAAVHYAHQNLVVHRDLKPENVLVTADGTPKLLDFGIAKVLGPDATEGPLVTKPVGRIMTVRYASPEQIRGEPITTASDIYSLGVLLYELLTDRWPYRLDSLSEFEMERAICEADPEKPSDAINRPIGSAHSAEPKRGIMRQQLAGDLDAIVLMALRKEPARRYGSAEQFSEDIRRYLSGVPVIARKDTFRYRARLFARRHKAGVAAAAIVLLTLLAGITATSMQARVAREERTRAELRFTEVRQLANALLFEFDDAIATLPGSTSVRQRLVKRALQHLDGLAVEAADDRSLRRELATAYSRIGVIQWNRYYSNIGDIAGALESQRRALAMRRALVDGGLNDPDTRRELADSFIQLGDVLVGTGDVTGALASYREAMAQREQLLADEPGSAALRRDLFVAYQRMGDNSGNPAFRNVGDTDAAIAYYGKMLALMKGLAAEHPDDPSAQHSLSIGLEKMGDMQRAVGQHQAALDSYRQALAVRDSLATAQPTNARYLRDLAVSHGKVGVALVESGYVADALTSYDRALQIRQALATADPGDAQAQADLAMIQDTIGQALFALKDFRRAAQRYDTALRILDKLVASDPSNEFLRSLLVEALERQVLLKRQTDDAEAAHAFAARALELKRR